MDSIVARIPQRYPSVNLAVSMTDRMYTTTMFVSGNCSSRNTHPIPVAKQPRIAAQRRPWNTSFRRTFIRFMIRNAPSIQHNTIISYHANRNWFCKWKAVFYNHSEKTVFLFYNTMTDMDSVNLIFSKKWPQVRKPAASFLSPLETDVSQDRLCISRQCRS